MEKWTKDKERELVRLRQSGVSVMELCDLFHRTESSIRSKLYELGITIVDVGTWLPMYDKVLRDYYAKLDYKKIMELIPHKTRRQINYKAKQMGLKKQRDAKQESSRLSHLVYIANVSNIINLDTPDGAALFGFILADGTIYSDKNVVKITLAKKDKRYLEKIKLVLDYDKSIKSFPSEERGAVTLNINSKELVDFIIANVDYSKKSVDLKYPDIIKGHKYEADFIRGFFDGDGCITKYSSKSKRGQFAFSLISTKEMCLAIQDSLTHLCDIELRNRKLRKETRIKADNIYYLEYCESSLIHIGNVMYKSVIDGESSLYLDRKLDRFKELWGKHGLW